MLQVVNMVSTKEWSKTTHKHIDPEYILICTHTHVPCDAREREAGKEKGCVRAGL